MDPPCFDIDTLSELLEAGPEDPRREHVRSCIRCRNLLESLREFRSPESELPAAEVREAEERMAAVLERALGAPAGIAHAGERATRPAGESFWARAWSGLFAAGWWRPALGAALIAVVLLTSIQIFDREGPVPPEVLRSDGPEAPRTIVLQPPRLQPEGGLLLAWETFPEAEAYQVTFYDLHLEKLANFEVGPATSLSLTPADLRALGPPGQRLLWRVVALRDGSEMAHSAAAGAALP